MRDLTFGTLSSSALGLFTDLYELRMMAGYYEHDHTPEATFDLFVRTLPADRGYLIAAGIEQVLAFVESISFEEPALSYLAEQGFSDAFLEELADFEFSGDIRAVPEGTPVFPTEPILEVTAPLPQAQLLETVAINQVGYQTLIATKARRMRDVVDRLGDEQTLVDFGTRRAHGTDAGIKAARASRVGGFDGTSNVVAGELFDLPVVGTMAHSWVQSFEHEREAFERFLESYGEDSVLLVDTYDTEAGIALARDVATETGVDPRGIRLDSGDLATLSNRAQEIYPEPATFVSSGLDEYAIREFLESGGVADGFGPGTSLTTSADAPAGDFVYKLVAIERDGEMAPTMKLSSGKVTYPGRKSVTRVREDGVPVRDVVGLTTEDLPGEALLETVVEGGEVLQSVSIEDARGRAESAVRELPVAHRLIDDPASYEIQISDELSDLAETVQRDLETTTQRS